MKASLFFFLFATFSGVFAQDWLLRNQVLYLSLGISDIYVQKTTATNRLDFMNYMEGYEFFGDFFTFKLGFNFDYFSHMHADISILMDYGLLNGFDASTYYFFNKSLGLGLGTGFSTSYISGFGEYQQNLLPGYYLLNNYGFWEVYDWNFYISPVLRMGDNERMNFVLRLNMGFSRFTKQKTEYYYKKKNSNEKLHYIYETLPGFQPFIRPEIQFRYRVFKINKFSAGLLVHTFYYYAHRRIDYRICIRRWTYNNCQAQIVHPPSHAYGRLDIDAGFYLKW